MIMSPMVISPMLISPMLSFLAPDRLWLLLLIPALVALYLWLYRRRAQRRKQQYGRSMLDFVIPRELPWKRHVAVGLSVLSLMTLTVAFAKPKSTVEVPRERATVVVAIDVSNSMMALDVKPDRLTAAKAGAKQFVQSLPAKFNVSVVEFAITGTVLLPPTTDHGAAEAAISSMRLQPGTAIGEGIFTSLSAAAEAPPDPDHPNSKPPVRIVLLSDGKTQSGRPSAEAAQAAKKQNIEIYTVAYGTPDGYIDIQGTRQPVPVDRRELAEVAKITGGEAYRAETAGELKQVYKDIGSSVGKVKVDREVTYRYAGFGLVFAILASIGMISLGARWP